jgi:hypothetical protein
VFDPLTVEQQAQLREISDAMLAALRADPDGPVCT